MRPDDLKIELTPRKTIMENLVFIDGLMRTGKHLAANIAASFERCEMWQNLVLAESAPIYHTLGKITTDAAIQMIQTEIDIHFYYSLIGRRVNFRRNDASSIWNSRDPEEYLRRVESPSEHAVLGNLSETNPISLVFTHEVICHPDVVFAAYPNVKFILTQRNPVGLVDSWIRKKWGGRIGNDPVSTMPAVGSTDSPVPWFAYDWQDAFLEMENADRIIHSIKWLKKLEDESIENLPDRQKKQVLKIYLEDFSINPERQINDMCSFLATELSAASPGMFKKLGIPTTYFTADYDRKLKAIKKKTDPTSFKLLMEMEEEYNSDFKKYCGMDFSSVLK